MPHRVDAEKQALAPLSNAGARQEKHMNKRLDRSLRSLRSAVLYLAGAAALAAWQPVEAGEMEPGRREAALQDGSGSGLLVCQDQRPPDQQAPLDRRA